MSLDVSLGVLQLLISDVQCSAKWFTAAVKCCLDANMRDVAVALCYTLIPRGSLVFSNCTRIVLHQNECNVGGILFVV